MKKGKQSFPAKFWRVCLYFISIGLIVGCTSQTDAVAKASVKSKTSEVAAKKMTKNEAGIESKSAAANPTSWDWRNVNGKDYTTPVVDQGSSSCSSCVSFGVSATIETAARIQANIPSNSDTGINIDNLSEAWLYFCNLNSCTQGWNIPSALDYAKNKGVPSATCCEYDLNKCCEKQPVQAARQQPDIDKKSSCSWQPYGDCKTCCQPYCSDCDKKKTTIINTYTKLQGVDEIKDWIINNGPVAVSLYIPAESFCDYSNKDEVFTCPGSSYAGFGHVISCIGFDDDKGAWLCKNSFGKKWGNDGYMWLKYDACMIGNTGFGIKNFKQIACSCADGSASCSKGSATCENNVFKLK